MPMTSRTMYQLQILLRLINVVLTALHSESTLPDVERLRECESYPKKGRIHHRIKQRPRLFDILMVNISIFE